MSTYDAYVDWVDRQGHERHALRQKLRTPFQIGRAVLELLEEAKEEGDLAPRVKVFAVFDFSDASKS